MGERDIDDIIERWRDSARAAGEPAMDGPRGRAADLVRRVGRLRLAAAAAALVAFALIAVPLLATGAAPSTPAGQPGADSAATGAEGPLPPAADPGGADAGAERPQGAAEPGSAAPGGAGPTDEGSAAPAPATRVDEWFAVLEHVDAVRGSAYAAADAVGLAGAFEEGGSAMARERSAVEAMRASGVSARQWRTELLSVSPLVQTDERVTLRVRDRRGPYLLVAADGTETAVPAAAPASWLVTLIAREGRWLVAEASPEVTTPREQP